VTHVISNPQHGNVDIQRSPFSVASRVRGYHVYQDEWEAVLGEVLSCQREPGNRHDPYAVATVSDGRTGHVPNNRSTAKKHNAQFLEHNNLMPTYSGDSRPDIQGQGIYLPYFRYLYVAEE